MNPNEQKTALLTIKLPPSVLEDFRIASMLRGATMSGLVQQFVTKIVREEREAVPDAFRRRQDLANRSDPEGSNLN